MKLGTLLPRFKWQSQPFLPHCPHFKKKGQRISSRVPRLLQFLSRKLSAQYCTVAVTATTICHSFVERNTYIERHTQVFC